MTENENTESTPVSLDEILALYKKTGADPDHTSRIRTTINTGTLSNTLHANRPNGSFRQP